jgi:hypothetical protein
MKRIIVTLIVALMVFGLLPFMPKTAHAETDPENSRATIIVNRWHRVGENEYGDPLTDGRTFPWQAAQNSQAGSNDETLGGYWGRTDYGMPNSNIAVSPNRIPRAARLNTPSTVQPMLWTTVYLTVIANDGSSRPITNEAGDVLTLGKWYVVMDEAGQVWFDMDGRFNDSRYTATANPFSPFYEWDLQQTPGANGGAPTTTGATGRCLTNPRALVDPSEANNTQGPYHFTATLSDGTPNPFYTEPCYFWVKPELTKIVSSESGRNICDAYGGHTLRGESRVWQLGIGSRPDYMAIQRTSPLGLYQSDGVVRDGEWDIGLPMIPFAPTDMYAQATAPGFFTPPNPNAVFDPEDDMYRILGAPHVNVMVGDTRLTNVTAGTPPNTITYLAGSSVQPGNADIGRALTTLAGTSFRFSPKNPSPIATRLSFAFTAGATAISVDDPSKLSPGMTISIGPNAAGQTEIRTVMSVALQPSVTWVYYQYNWGYWYPWGPPPPYAFYIYPSYSNALTPGHLVMVGTEVLQVATVDYAYPPYFWNYFPAVTFTTPPTTAGSWQGYGTQLRTLPNVITLDAPLTNSYERGNGISIMSFAPGDFIYSSTGAAHNAVQVGDVRFTDIDDHRTGNVIIGQGAWEDDALVMMEVLFGDPNDPRYQGMVNDSSWQKNTANTGNRTMSTQDTAYGHCMPKFDISMESDFWQGERVWVQDASGQWITQWRGVTPSVTSFAMRSPNADIRPTALRVAKSTVLDPDGQSFFVHTATAHDLQPDYREYLGVQLLCDNGYDNLASPKNFNGYVRPTAQNLSDDYIRATRCEAYLGATDKGVDLDLGRKLTTLDGSQDLPKFFRSNPNSTPLVPSGLPPFGCGDVIYFDLNNNNIVDKLDRRATEVTVRRIDPATGNSMVMKYFAESIVAEGDLDAGRPLSRFDLHYKWYDVVHPVSRVPSGKLELNEDIYWDQTELSAPNGNGFVNGSDVRHTDVEIDQTVYRCGEVVGIGDAFFNQYPVKMLTLGKNGNYNYLDMPVLPFPTMDVKVEIDKQLKVEQTSHISITVEPPPKPGESIFVALRETKINSRQPVPERQIYSQQKNQPMNWIDPVCDGQYGSGIVSTANSWQYGGGSSITAPQVPLPFPFRFYGIDYTHIYIAICGMIQFGGTNIRESLLSGYYYGDLAPQLNTNTGRPRAHIANYIQVTDTSVCWGDAIWPPTGETVFVIRWRTRTKYYYTLAYNGEQNEYEMILFPNGNILMQYRTLYANRYNYFYRPYSPYGLTPLFDIGITNADGVNYSEYMPDETLPYTAMSNVLFVPVTLAAIPGIPELKLAEDTKWLTPDNKTANIEFTPWRGTCLQDGSRSPIEINVYRDIGGDDINVPRNPPPSTYMEAREPSYSSRNPWNGIVIAVNQTFGYEVGDQLLIGTNTNIERRKIVQIHYGTSGQNTRMAYNSPASLTNNPTYIVPVLDVTDMKAGNPIVIGDTSNQAQETHIITSTYAAPNPRTAIRINSVDVNSGSPVNTQIGINKIIRLNQDPVALGWTVGQFIGLGYSPFYQWIPIDVTNPTHWWNRPPAVGDQRDTVKIIEINPPGFPNSIRVANLHVNAGSYNWYGIQQTGIEVRDPIKFAHGPVTMANEPVYTTKYAFTLDRGLDFNHIFGDTVVGVAYFDPYWVDHKWDLFDLDRYPSRSFADLLPPDPISPDLDNGYDCYWRGRYNIDPEEIINKPELKKCLSTLDQRYPNVLISLWDADNPNDVNDPANIPISAPAGMSGADRTIIANVNATGAGVAWLATVRGFITSQGDGIATHRYILQVNVDGSYEWWRWYEPLGQPTQIVGALDPNDWLYRWLDDDPDTIVQPPPIRTPVPQWDNAYDQFLSDNDCSVGKGVCDPCNKDNLWPCLGDVSFRDSYGRFMGLLTDPYSAYPNLARLPGTTPVFGRIETFGIPCAVERWQQYSTPGASPNDGGQVMFPVHPRQQGQLTIRVYLYDAIFDYNSTNIHTPGPYFTQDTSYGIDYCGYYTYDVPAPDAAINFIEMRTIDHALQNSQVNYTSGVSPLYSMKDPAPRIQAAYYPILNDYKLQFRCYPGGQSHPGRLTGVSNRYWFGSGWNAYPAIWHKQFVKLGTEFFPMTDYGIYFILANALGNHLGFAKDPATEPDLLINYIRITGPFMTPRYYNPESLNCILGGRTTPFYQYNNVRGLPIGYDYSGEILVDAFNAGAYHDWAGRDYSNIVNPLSVDNYTYTNPNSWLSKWKDLLYSGFWQTRTTWATSPTIGTPNRTLTQPVGVNVFDEIIPIGPGKISIEVELADGTKKIYEDCCEAKTSGLMREIPVHGLKIDGLPLNVTVDTDNIFEIKLTEDTGKGMIKENGEWLNVECNNALLFAWQDRGIIDGSTKLRIGTLDGRITNPPYSSKLGDVEFQFEKTYDLDGDNKISYKSLETEILGTYDLVTNTWQGGYIDARTFQRENGMYKFELTDAFGCRVDTVGVDIGGVDRNGRPLARDKVDHIIDDTEVCPIIITAYKYGDDNNDRAFTPLYDEVTRTNWSHEVYLAGQQQVEVEPMRDLSVTYGPEPLTAGVVSEIVGEPLTFTVKDYNNKPIDLSKGMPDSSGNDLVLDEAIWRNLFKDPHPDNLRYYGREARLPQYYWLRTDLHNLEDEIGHRISNTNQYNTAFLPIQIDFTKKADGKYTFKGFIANDKGQFETYIYTPDRKHSAVISVKVASPKVKYEIINMEDQEQTFHVPGDPDFVMTAGDNRIYKVTVTCSNAQDALLKGIAKSVSVCSGLGEDTARFTPCITPPLNWYYGHGYRLYLGVDTNGDGKLTNLSYNRTEYNDFYSPVRAPGFVADMFYNTFNMRYSDYNYEYSVNYAGNWYPWIQTDKMTFRGYGQGIPQLTSRIRCFGAASHYNDLYDGTYLFADLTTDNALTFQDSLSLDQNARTTFFVYATGATYLTGLVGNNEYCNSATFGDVAINPLLWGTQRWRPNYLKFRYQANISSSRQYFSAFQGNTRATFALDWEAFADRKAEIGSPKIVILDPASGEEWGKAVADPEFYDLIYAVPNHMLLRVYPADPKDLPMHEGNAIQLGNTEDDMSHPDNKHEFVVLGKLVKSPEDNNIRETNVYTIPTATGKKYASFYMRTIYTSSINQMEFPWFQSVSHLVSMDVIKGMAIEAEIAENLKVNRTTKLKLKVTVSGGSTEPVADAKIKIEGVVDAQSGTTNQKGEVEFQVNPKQVGKIKIVATHDKLGKAFGTVGVETEIAPPMIIIEPLSSITNKTEVTIKGKTNPGNIVKIGGQPVKVGDDGSFTFNYKLTNEGYNQFDVEAVNPAGFMATQTITITRDTTAPTIICDQEDPTFKFNPGATIRLTGRVEPYSKVNINGVDANVVYDSWTVEIPNTGTSTIALKVEATDMAGNKSTKDMTIELWKTDTIIVSDGDPNVIVNGNPLTPLSLSPYVDSGYFMVPVDLFTQIFGQPPAVANDKKVSLTIGNVTYELTDDKAEVTFGGATYALTMKVVNKNGIRFVESTSFAQLLGLNFDWNQVTKVLTLWRLYK